MKLKLSVTGSALLKYRYVLYELNFDTAIWVKHYVIPRFCCVMISSFRAMPRYSEE